MKNPHLLQAVTLAGAPLSSARAAVIAVHGRARDPADILTLETRIGVDGLAWLAPAAAGGSWYPQRLMQPIESNEPWLGFALERIASLISELEDKGFHRSRIALLGFSQGGCLITEYAVRNAARFGGIISFTGGLIGPPGTRWDYKSSFAGTPVFLGTSDVDEWVPVYRIRETAKVMRNMGANLKFMIYPGMGHEINDDEVEQARKLLQGLPT